jgi:hypothetical protein
LAIIFSKQVGVDRNMVFSNLPVCELLPARGIALPVCFSIAMYEAMAGILAAITGVRFDLNQ